MVYWYVKLDAYWKTWFLSWIMKGNYLLRCHFSFLIVPVIPRSFPKLQHHVLRSHCIQNFDPNAPPLSWRKNLLHWRLRLCNFQCLISLSITCTHFFSLLFKRKAFKSRSFTIHEDFEIENWFACLFSDCCQLGTMGAWFYLFHLKNVKFLSYPTILYAIFDTYLTQEPIYTLFLTSHDLKTSSTYLVQV